MLEQKWTYHDNFFVYNTTAPTDAPEFLKETKTTSSSITLQWSPPDTPNGVIENYIIYYNAENKTGSRNKTEIGGLKAFTEYTFTIACNSSGGLGPKSEPISAKTAATG